MRIIVQRALEAYVKVDGKVISKTGPGLLLLVGITHTDNKDIIKRAALKVLKMRLWKEIPKEVSNKPVTNEIEIVEENKEEGNRELKTWASSVMDNSYELLVVS